MAKTENVDFIELFGADTVRGSLNADLTELLQRAPVALPMDSPLYDFEPASRAGDAIESQVTDADLFEKIVGFAPVRPTSIPAAAPTMMQDFTKRAAHVLREAPAHRRAIQTIIDRFRHFKAFAPVRDDPAWDRLVQSGTDFVTSAVLGGA